MQNRIRANGSAIITDCKSAGHSCYLNRLIS